MKQQRGFTLIELVMVIVILGILAAVAIPKFVDLTGDAAQAAADGVGGALSSAATVNYAARTANSANGVAIAKCSDTSGALQGGALPTGYSIVAPDNAALPGATASCTVSYTKGTTTKTAAFTTIGIN